MYKLPTEFSFTSFRMLFIRVNSRGNSTLLDFRSTII